MINLFVKFGLTVLSNASLSWEYRIDFKWPAHIRLHLASMLYMLGGLDEFIWDMLPPHDSILYK